MIQSQSAGSRSLNLLEGFESRMTAAESLHNVRLKKSIAGSRINCVSLIRGAHVIRKYR